MYNFKYYFHPLKRDAMQIDLKSAPSVVDPYHWLSWHILQL